jgi:hypothetical protein
VHGLQNVGVATHTQIVVGAPNRHTLLLGCHVSAWELLRQTVDVVEVAVRLVLMLLLQLIVVEAFIIELANVVGRRIGSPGRFGRERSCASYVSCGTLYYIPK